MGRLFELIDAYRDSHAPYPPSYAKIAEQVGVSRQTLLNWREPTGWITRTHLEAVARTIGVPYLRVLDAMLEDIGYISASSPGSEPSEKGKRRTG